MAKIVYKNWFVETGAYFDPSIVADFETDAPASNMLTEIPGQVAICSGVIPPTFRVYIDGGGSSPVGRPVDVVAIVNTNAIVTGAAPLSVTLHDSTGGQVQIDTWHTNGRGEGNVLANFIFLVSEGTGSGDPDDIVHIDFNFDAANIDFGRLDKWANLITVEAPFLGTLVAGPALVPANGIRLEGYTPGVSDPSQVIQSIGGTTWTNQRTRLQRVTGEFALLTESEIEAEPPLCGVRQLAEHCGISRPALFVLNDDEVGNQTVYALFTEPLSWSAIDKVADPSGLPSALEPAYRCGFSLIEAR